MYVFRFIYVNPCLCGHVFHYLKKFQISDLLILLITISPISIKFTCASKILKHCLVSSKRFSQRTQHILLSLMDMVQNARAPSDLDHVYDLTTTLLQYGANPNINISTTEPMICHSQSSVFLKKSSNQVCILQFSIEVVLFIGSIDYCLWVILLSY